MAIDFSSSTELRIELLQYFQHNELAEEDLLSECIKLCQNFHITPENVYYKWEALNFNTGRSVNLFTMDSVNQIKAAIQQDLAKEQAKKARAQLSGRMTRGRAPVLGLPGRMGTPVKRSTVGGAQSSGAGASVAGPSKVKFVGPSSDPAAVKKRAYRYMYEKISERSEVLDDRIDDFAELIRTYYSISEFGDPGSSTDEETTIVGRIVPDAESLSTKLNDASVVLETSKMLGSGARVPLRFDPSLKITASPSGGELAGIGLFPGAIVAMRGRNGGGGYFLVTEILNLPPLRTRPVDEASETSGGDDPGSVFIACGPYTPDTDLGYKPWTDLLKKIKAKKPDVLILLGPFISTDHPYIRQGLASSPPAELFRDTFLAPLAEFLASAPGSAVVLVPSVKDIISDHAVFPQAELPASLMSDPRIHLAPNPARFSLNGITFGASTVDVLFHLRKEEYFKRSLTPVDQPQDAMSSLCRHVLQQHSFYPIFPAPHELAHDVNLDVSHSAGLALDAECAEAAAPDVLILPSRLKHFSKVVEDTVAINPTFLTKGIYAEMRLPARRTAGLKDEILKRNVMKLEE
ncbi:DNA polymerase alpha, subunit B [Gloeophyllum trabeum ATCC 11539]|uniref:DNA polymerase alpha subunit B n=1 Tax=Gloeophyllum trabeum (strain ATCC 11539 / FP-39264 / Madison 617) TaxID=670483 RepID=S7Q5J2_GLOTA|nr:DNA polymerase alpha, subunit B [Gloeophyllum trabeum ATCC 11539]EPQ54753.1 DNA polymerase alpha, subunit B [Gloeophyllum trabeum ATCC 11539]